MPDPYGFAQSGDIGDDEESWRYIDVQGPGTVKFKWKVSSESGCDTLEFTVDGNYYDSRSGDHDWAPKSSTISGSGSHRLQWRYYKDGSESVGDDCGWIKDVNFTPAPPPGESSGESRAASSFVI